MPEPDRSRLPIPDATPDPDAPVPFDAKDPAASFPPIEPLRPPAGAPNVLVILLDDVGFAASSAFGGPCNTPTAERLAAMMRRSPDGLANLRTVEGGPISIGVRRGALVIFDESGNRYPIAQTDVTQSNGVVHVIGGVLLPK